MAPPTNLRDIGLEGFGLIDKLNSSVAPSRRPNSCRVFPARQGRWVVQVPNDEMEEVAMNSKEIAARFGGILAVNYFKGKPQIRCGKPIRT
ncbi:hypothetical protein SESBI_33601 [Sesbania bispinosa]|nr:hypothetical protein SESBI_33601 [Sesbania bispinosa]